MILEDKNNAQRFTEELKVEDGFYLLKFQSELLPNQKNRVYTPGILQDMKTIVQYPK